MNFDDASKALVELAASRHNAFHTTEAAALNIDSQRLRRAQARGELEALFPKVWAVRSLPSSSGQRLRAAVLATPKAAAGQLSAAWLHGWVAHAPQLPQVWVPEWVRRRETVVVNQRNKIDLAKDVTEVGSIRTLNKAATLCLLGTTADPMLVEKCLDEFLRTESEAWLAATMDRLYSDLCTGSRCLASVLADPRRVAGVTDSWLERVVSKLISFPWMPPIVLQHPVSVDGRNFRLDVACPELMLGVEAHGRTFHWGPGKVDADNERDIVLTSAGWQVIYVTYSQVINPDRFVQLFESAARARAAQLQVALPRPG